MKRLGWMSALALVFALVASPVFAQGGSSSATLSGVVVDKDGGLIPGATVVVTNAATGEKLPTVVTNDKGAYSFPGLSIGTYKVTVTLSGFKTSETEVRLVGGSTNNITSTLEIGKVEEVVNVRAGSELVRTETPAVSQTVTADFMNTLPRNSRSALAFLAFLPGVSTTGSANNLRNGSNVTGLGSNTVNITLDGVSNNAMNNNQGFFMLVTPRLDAVEEVTLTNSSAGADATGQGAVQVRFVTRSGTNKFDTSGYLYYQNAVLNSNAYFTRLAGNPKALNTSYTYGGRVGGPIVLPGFDGRGKAFFFFNWEEVYNPNQVQRSGRTFLRQVAQDGNFTYGAVGSQTTVNVLDLAKTFGQVSTPDADVTRILNNIRDAAGSLGKITELVTSPNTATHDWLVTNKSTNHAPTTNLTFNITPKHRLQGSYYYQKFFLGPDTLNTAEPVFPGLTPFGIQDSFRTSASISLRSTLSTAIVNEARVGWQYSPINFFLNIQASEFDWMGGFAFGGQTFLTGNQPGLGFGLTQPTSTFANTPSTGKTPVYVVSDQFNYLKGSHSFTFGGDWTHVIGDNLDTQAVPAMNLGFNQTFDPAETAGMFAAANFPNSSTGDRNNARALYALLTGRVTSIVATANLNNAGDAYVYNGPLYTSMTQEEYSAYAQDTWRVKPTVTITAGLRYQLQMPIASQNGVFSSMSAVDACGAASGLANGKAGSTSTTSTSYLCNIYNPNPTQTDVSPGVVPQYVQYSASTKGYDTDFNNLAPNVGVSWRPNKQDGFLRTLLGDPELATINVGYSRSYSRERLSNFLTAYSGKPGQNINVTRSTALADFPIVPANESWPLLFREKSRLTAPTFNATPQYPASALNQTASLFDPTIGVPNTDSWNVSLQRALTKDTVVEIRYQGNNGSRGTWTFQNLNGVNIYDNVAPGGVTNGGSWLTGRQGVGLPGGEFEKAMGNLRANILAGKGATFAYTGAGTQPLPILLAHLAKSTDVANPAAYVGLIWTNATFTGYLDPYFPDPSQFASNLYSSSAAAANVGAGVATRYFNNALALGYPRNFWVANPDVSNLNVGMNSDNEPLNHQVILQVRRRLSAGLAVQAGYTWSRYFSGLQGISSNVRNFGDLHTSRINLRSSGVPHAIQTLWTYDIPFGRGKRFGANTNAWIDGIAGGWTFSGTARFQTQSFVLRGVELSDGYTLKQAQKDLSVLRFVTDPITGAQTVWNFPEEIYTNTIKAFSTDETQAANGYYAPGTEPTGKYFKPAGGVMADGSLCTYLYPGDCGNQDMWFLGRWFGEMDFALAKQFQLPGRARFEMRAEVFNATKALNFPNTINPSSSTNAFRITSTQSGARTAQLVWRVSW